MPCVRGKSGGVQHNGPPDPQRALSLVFTAASKEIPRNRRRAGGSPRALGEPPILDAGALLLLGHERPERPGPGRAVGVLPTSTTHVRILPTRERSTARRGRPPRRRSAPGAAGRSRRATRPNASAAGPARRVLRSSRRAGPEKRGFEHRAKRGRASARWRRWPTRWGRRGRRARRQRSSPLPPSAARRSSRARRLRIDPPAHGFPRPQTPTWSRRGSQGRRRTREREQTSAKSDPSAAVYHGALAAILTLRRRPETVDVSRRRSLMQRRRPAAARILSAVAGLAFGLLGAELTFGQLRPDEPRSEAVLYSIEVRNGAGDLLASPMLIGEEGRPVHLNLAQDGGPRREPLAMSLDLEPHPDGGDNLCLGYRLSIDDGFAHSGRMGISYGELSSVELTGGGESLRLSLVVARAHTREFGRILQRHRRPTA